jgi:GT2 family glycosyltransferase
MPEPGGFDEDVYLRLNPDVLNAVAAGKFRNGREHYERFGRTEGRPTTAPGLLPPDKVVMTTPTGQGHEKPRAPGGAVDGVKLSGAGGIYIAGWANDALDRLDCIDLYFSGWSISFSGANLARVRRPDAEAHASTAPHQIGFWGFIHAARRLTAGMCSAMLRFKSGAEMHVMLAVEAVDDQEMRNIALAGLAQAQYLGNPYFAAVASIDAATGTQLVDFNQTLTRRAVSAPYVERFGRATSAYKGSIIVCLYGKPEYMFLQQALFSRLPGIQDYEFIYVCNSPEMAEPLLKEARRCTLIYGLDLTLIVLAANAGFGAANNLAAQHARSNRLLFVNPDVFPYDAAWAARHSTVLESLPPERTSLFGAPLYYDDSSLMHAGMYFEMDVGPSFLGGRRQETSILRVEHYGKGAPPETPRYLHSRPVPAITGAFMSVEQDWFESLGGFTEDYIFGHYEDADLCLKSLEAGRAPWLHDVRLYHLEGKGSTRQPAHEGGSAVNRWLFTRTWGEMVVERLLGATPSHKLLAAEEMA